MARCYGCRGVACAAPALRQGRQWHIAPLLGRLHFIREGRVERRRLLLLFITMKSMGHQWGYFDSNVQQKATNEISSGSDVMEGKRDSLAAARASTRDGWKVRAFGFCSALARG